MEITICGGGGLGHTCAAMLSQQSDVRVNMLSRHSEGWRQVFDVRLPDGTTIEGRLSKITSRPEDVIPGSDIVLLCLPAFCVEEQIKSIKPYLRSGSAVGTVISSSGFFLFCHNHLPLSTKLFGFQRVPYISRVVEYGKSANLLGFRDELIMAAENIADIGAFKSLIERLFREKVRMVDRFYEVTLSNSNPILHTGRLYTMWKDWDGKPYDRCPLFYREWTDEASALEIEMDREFFALLKALNVNTANIDTLLAHYEATDAAGITRKLQSIPSFATIPSPMKQTAEGWVPDFTSRYFTEDFPYGLHFIWDLAHKNNVVCPTIDKVYAWGAKMIEQ